MTEKAYLIALLMKRYSFADDNINSTTAEQLLEVLDDYVLNAGGYVNDN